MPGTYKLTRVRDGREFPIDSSSSMLVGRSESCEITVDQGHPSREHARIADRGQGLILQDLHSTNGTYVNNQQIHGDTSLKPGDVVKFAEEAFSVQLQNQGDATVVLSAIALKDNFAGAMVVEDDDEDDEDSTSFLEAFSLPPGWSDVDATDAGDTSSDMDPKKQRAIDQFVGKFAKSLGQQAGMLLFFFANDEPPIIRTLKTQDAEKEWRFGRGQQCEIAVNNDCISKEHGLIKRANKQWTIEDQGSTNGIWLGSKQQQTLALKDGMKLKISSVDILVRIIK